MECYFEEWPKLKDMLILMKLRKDYLILDTHMRKCYYQKKAWRQIKSKMTGDMYTINRTISTAGQTAKKIVAEVRSDVRPVRPLAVIKVEDD